MPPDVEILTWLRSQLIVVRDFIPSLARALEMDFELILQTISTNPDDLIRLREQLAENDEILGLTDDELIALFRESYVDYLNSVFHVMDSEMTYEEKYLEIQRLSNILYDEYAAHNFLSTGQIAWWYNIMIRNTANFKALKAAIEIYLIKAKTGQLPETLLDGLPKDPYSGQDFEYEVTSQGFVLRCRKKEIGEDKLREYEFFVVE